MNKLQVQKERKVQAVAQWVLTISKMVSSSVISKLKTMLKLC